MTSVSERTVGTAPWRPAMLAAGFRPFYLLAAVWAALAVPLWLHLRTGQTEWMPVFSGAAWHAHEMIFGFAAAVLVGFLYTAVPNWTGRPTPTGWRLLMLALLWLAGRAAMVAGASLPWWAVAAVDVAFLPLAAIGIAIPLATSRNRRNIAFPFVLLGLALLNLLFHLQEAGILGAQVPVPRLTLDIFAVVLLVMSGRVIPFFGGNALPEAGIARNEAMDRLAVVATVAALAASWVLEAGVVTGALAVAAAGAVRLRMLPWRAGRQLRVPMLAVLVAGHWWLAAWLLLRGLSDIFPQVSPLAADHALGVGALGMLALGMMARSALGHTGRRIAAGPALVVAFAAVMVAGIVRVAAPILPHQVYEPGMWLSGALWTVAFAVFTVIFLPILARPRADGRAG